MNIIFSVNEIKTVLKYYLLQLNLTEVNIQGRGMGGGGGGWGGGRGLTEVHVPLDRVGRKYNLTNIGIISLKQGQACVAHLYQQPSI